MILRSLLVFALFVLFVNTAYGSVLDDTGNYILSNQFIDETNRLANGMWKAERSFHPQTSTRKHKSMSEYSKM